MDPNTKSQSAPAPQDAHDNRPVAQHLSNLECALFSEVESVNIQTKLFAVDVVRKKVWSFLGCDKEFSEMHTLLQKHALHPHTYPRLKSLMTDLKAKAASLTD